MLNDKWGDVFVCVGEFELLRINVYYRVLKFTSGITLDLKLFLEKDTVPLTK